MRAILTKVQKLSNGAFEINNDLIAMSAKITQKKTFLETIAGELLRLTRNANSELDAALKRKREAFIAIERAEASIAAAKKTLTETETEIRIGEITSKAKKMLVSDKVRNFAQQGDMIEALDCVDRILISNSSIYHRDTNPLQMRVFFNDLVCASEHGNRKFSGMDIIFRDQEHNPVSVTNGIHPNMTHRRLSLGHASILLRRLLDGMTLYQRSTFLLAC